CWPTGRRSGDTSLMMRGAPRRFASTKRFDLSVERLKTPSARAEHQPPSSTHHSSLLRPGCGGRGGSVFEPDRPRPRSGDGPLLRRSFPMLALTTPVPTTSFHDLQAIFLAEVLPRIETHAEVSFRGLRCHHQKEEFLAEMVALAWRWFLRLIEKG